MNIADRIQKLRKAKGISQEQFADVVGVSRQAVSKWESEQSIPDLEKVILMSDYFGVTTDYILKGIEPTENNETKAGGKFSNKVKATVCMSFGLIVNFVIYIVSRFVEVPIPYSYIQNGHRVFEWDSNHVAHSFRYFVEYYDLQFLMILSWIAVVVGIIWLSFSMGVFRKKR